MTAPGSPVPYGTIPANSGSQPNYDASGAIDIWQTIPNDIRGHQFWFDTGHSTGAMQGGGRETHGPGMNIKAQRSFPINADAETVMKQFTAMAWNDPGKFRALQAALAQGPWGLSIKNFTGQNDPETQLALAKAMVSYIQTSESSGVGISFLDFITKSAQMNLNQPGGGSSGTSSPVLTDPDTLKLYAQKAAQAALGRNLSGKEIAAFIDQFHSQQITAQSQAAGGNGAVVDKNDPRASAIGYVTQGHQQEFDQHQIQGYTDSFLNMFLPQGSSAPNVNVDPSAVSY